MKKVLLSVAAVATLGSVMTSCGGGYSEEAGKVADGICECVGEDMEKDHISSCLMGEMMGSEKMVEIAKSEDAEKASEAFALEIQNAIQDKCPKVYDVVKDM